MFHIQDLSASIALIYSVLSSVCHNTNPLEFSLKAIITTCEKNDAIPLLEQLLQQKLVACGNIFAPVQSMYWWNGTIQKEEEAFLFMETSDELVDSAFATLSQIHPYEVPKILVIHPCQVHEAYNRWIHTETKS